MYFEDLTNLRTAYPAQTKNVLGDEWTYIDTQQGESVVVLLPGAGGTSEVFAQQILALAPQQRVIAVDYPPMLDPARLANGLDLLLTRLEVTQALICGTSLGGHLAQFFAACFPERIRKLVVSNSFVSIRRRGLPPSFDPMQIAQKTPEQVKLEKIEAIKSSPDSPLKPVLLEQAQRLPAKVAWARNLAVLMAVPTPQLTLGREKVLIVDCEDDLIVPAPMRNELRDRYPDHVHSFKTGSHFPYLIHPTEFTALLSA